MVLGKRFINLLIKIATIAAHYRQNNNVVKMKQRLWRQAMQKMKYGGAKENAKIFKKEEEKTWKPAMPFGLSSEFL